MSDDRVRPSRDIANTDRVVLCLFAAWMLLGPLAYLLRRGGFPVWFPAAAVQLVTAAIAGVVLLAFACRWRKPSDYGMSFGRGGLVSLAVALPACVYLELRMPAQQSPWVVWMAFVALIEELCFRAVVINTALTVFRRARSPGLWAVLTSTTLFSLPHAFTKTFSEWVGVTIAGLVFAIVYWRSRSILLPACFHAAANAGPFGGWFALVVYSLLAGIDAIQCRPGRGAQTAVSGA